jgi:hypothetical protein
MWPSKSQHMVSSLEGKRFHHQPGSRLTVSEELVDWLVVALLEVVVLCEVELEL